MVGVVVKFWVLCLPKRKAIFKTRAHHTLNVFLLCFN